MEIVTRAAAASDLLTAIEGEIIGTALKVERASCIHQDITESYFGLLEITEENRWQLQAGYHEHSTKADVVWDYIYDVSQRLKKIEDLVNQAQKELKGEV